MADTSKADELKQLGNEAFAKQEYDEAITYYSDAIKINPKNHVFFSNRSACYAGKLEWEAAAADAKECIKLEPTFIKGYYRLATAQMENENLEAAMATIRQGLNIEPKNPQLERQLRSVQQLKKTREKAAAAGTSLRMPTTATDSGVSKELQDLHQQYVQTVREHRTVEANITMAQREYKAHEITKSELETLSTSTETRMYRSVGKMFMLSSQAEVMDHLEKAMENEKKRETELLQKQQYLERRIKSQQQNIQELTPSRE